jgi:Na+/alanine symporter
VALVGIAVGTWVVLEATVPAAELGAGDDSPYYWATWLFLPLVAFTVGIVRPGATRALASSCALVVPLMILVYIDGSIRWDTQENGANLWPIAELLLAVEGAVVLVGGLIGTALGKMRVRVRDGAAPPPWPIARRG